MSPLPLSGWGVLLCQSRCWWVYTNVSPCAMMILRRQFIHFMPNNIRINLAKWGVIAAHFRWKSSAFVHTDSCCFSRGVFTLRARGKPCGERKQPNEDIKPTSPTHLYIDEVIESWPKWLKARLVKAPPAAKLNIRHLAATEGTSRRLIQLHQPRFVVHLDFI